MISWLKKKIYNLGAISEVRLVQKVQAGDKEAFGKLYLKYLDSIYRYIFFRVNQDKQQAEDLTETVFMKALQNINKFNRPNGNFRAWLYGIAHNTVIDHYRTNKNHTSLENSPTEPSSIDNTEIILDTEQKFQSVLQAMNILTDEQKTVLMLRFIEEVPNNEIAQILGKNEDAVRALQYRGLKTLRQHIKV